MKKALVSLLSLVLVSASLAFGAAASATERVCDGGDVHSLRVRIWTNKQRYVVGEVARVHVKVVRRATDKAPASPAEGTTVTVGVTSDDVFLGGSAITDAAGRAIVKIKLPKYMSLGPVDAQAAATKSITDGPCLRTREVGADKRTSFFSIVG